MKLGFEEEQTPYSSASQSARAWTERWVRDWAFCPNCGKANVNQFESNRPVADFYCAACNEEFELKSQKRKFGSRIVDGAFRTMCERLAANNNPNLFLMNYDVKRLAVTDLLVVPKQFFVREVIEERPPLGPTARRAGWIGCNIRLDAIPQSGLIYLVRDGHPQPKELVLQLWRRTLFLREQDVSTRGWLLEVLKCVEIIGRGEFDLEDVYSHEEALRQIYPGNKNIRAKIRQQLQILRDRGYLDFLGRGKYRLRSVAE